MRNSTGAASRSVSTVSSTRMPPVFQHSGGVGVGGRVGSGVRVDQEVGEGSGGTVMVGIKVGGSGKTVSAGMAAEHPAASRKHNTITQNIRLPFIIYCIIR